MEPIASRHNTLVKRIRAAIREHAGEIVIEGPKQVEDAVAHGWKALAILERGRNITAAAFDAITETRSSQGVVGLFERPVSDPDAIIRDRDRVAIALDAVQDPGNVGTIVRLAAAFDAAGILVLPGCADPFGPKAIRSSAGAILNVRIAAISPEELLASGTPLVATAMNGATVAPPSRDAVLIFGNEGSGVSPALLERASTLTIPTSGRVESLNVASSAAILLARSYALRQ